MSDKLGPIAYGENQQEVFLGHSVTQSKNVSEQTAQMIDNEVRKLVDTGYEKARSLITDHLARLNDLANALLEHETLTGDEISAILRGEPMPKAPPQEPPSASAPTGGKRGSVPSTAPSDDADDTGGMEPTPQPGI
jgi:cell division protease FtsH